MDSNLLWLIYVGIRCDVYLINLRHFILKGHGHNFFIQISPNFDKVFNVHYAWLTTKGNFNTSKLVRNETQSSQFFDTKTRLIYSYKVAE